MRKRAIIVVGGTGYGKTTLLQAIMGKPLVYKKTQAIEHGPFAIDFPGEFRQRPLYYHGAGQRRPRKRRRSGCSRTPPPGSRASCGNP